MKVFISWSGERSKAVALALHEWLPRVIQSLDPWMSDRDIGAGAPSSAEINANLNEAQFGICCVTPENQEKPWLNYEAGALAKGLTTSRVVPYLFGFEDAVDMRAGPLSKLQAKLSNTQTLDVLAAINDTIKVLKLPGALTQDVLQDTYASWWDKLRVKLEGIPPAKEITTKPNPDDMIREILEAVRELTRARSTEIAPSVVPVVTHTDQDVDPIVVATNRLARLVMDNANDHLAAFDISIRLVRARPDSWIFQTLRNGSSHRVRVAVEELSGTPEEMAVFVARRIRDLWEQLAERNRELNRTIQALRTSPEERTTR